MKPSTTSSDSGCDWASRGLDAERLSAYPQPAMTTQLHTAHYVNHVNDGNDANDANNANNQAYYDDFSDWDERGRGRGYHQMLDDLELRVCAPLAIGRHVLEVGCGTGLILGRLAQHADSAWG